MLWPDVDSYVNTTFLIKKVRHLPDLQVLASCKSYSFTFVKNGPRVLLNTAIMHLIT